MISHLFFGVVEISMISTCHLQSEGLERSIDGHISVA